MINQKTFNISLQVVSIALFIALPISVRGTIAAPNQSLQFMTQGQLIAQSTLIPERRTALVIGNGGYGLRNRLTNPTNDATDVATALQSLGFEVILLRDANQRTMDTAIGQFQQKLRQGGVGLFYYAGHGMEVKGMNYLIPIDAKIDQESDIPYTTLPLNKVLDTMADAKNSVNLVILDACRDNPYARSWNRSTSSGLASVQSAQGMLISFATAPGKVADDGRGRNSPFTASLLQQLKQKDVAVESTFKAIRQSVVLETKGKQTPWESSSLIGDFSFNPSQTRFINPLPDAVPQRPIAPPPREEPSIPQPTPNPPAEPMRPPIGNTPTSTALTASRDGTQFQLKGCNRTGTSMRCELLITDETGSRNLCLHGRGTLPSAIIDAKGQQYLPERLEFGGGRSNGYSCEDLTQGIGLAGVLFFKNMPTKLNQVPLVEFGFHRKQDRFKIQFRDVPLGG